MSKSTLFYPSGYYSANDTGLYYCNARYYSPKWRRFISPDDTAYLNPESVNGLNLYCYCGNDPINYVDPSGHFVVSSLLVAAVIGGAIAGGFIGTASHLIVSGMDGTTVTAASVLSAFAVGALTGAIGAVGGAIGGTAAVIASAGVGVLSGAVTACKTEGSITRKLSMGLTAGVIAGFGTFLGTKIPVALDSAFALGFTAYTGGLFLGAQTELVSIAIQNFVGALFDWLESTSYWVSW